MILLGIIIYCVFAVRNWRLEAANHMGSCCDVSYLQRMFVIHISPKCLFVCMLCLTQLHPKLLHGGGVKTAVCRLVSQLSSHVLHNVFVREDQFLIDCSDLKLVIL